MIINNCSELLSFIYYTYYKPTYKSIIFQGDKCAILDTTSEIPGKCVYMNNDITIKETNSNIIIISHIAIALPLYIKEELIATIKEEW